MTIYTPFRKPRTNRKHRKEWDEHYSPSGRGRVLKAFEMQWKRYPNSRNIIDLRSGHKTHTLIYPLGHDSTFNFKKWISEFI